MLYVLSRFLNRFLGCWTYVHFTHSLPPPHASIFHSVFAGIVFVFIIVGIFLTVSRVPTLTSVKARLTAQEIRQASTLAIPLCCVKSSNPKAPVICFFFAMYALWSSCCGDDSSAFLLSGLQEVAVLLLDFRGFRPACMSPYHFFLLSFGDGCSGTTFNFRWKLHWRIPKRQHSKTAIKTMFSNNALCTGSRLRVAASLAF